MILFVGLGNVGSRYAHTRHNAGWWFLDWLVGPDIKRIEKKNHHGQIVPYQIGGIECLCVKPTTLMNASGLCVKSLCSYYAVPVKHIIIFHDELELLPGQRKFKAGGGMAGHNGLRSIATQIETSDFVRIRIGIGRPHHPSESVADFVLSIPSQTEKESIYNQFPLIDDFLRQRIPTIA